MSEKQEKPVVKVEVDTDDLNEDQLRLLEAFGLDDEALDPQPSRQYDRLDDLLEFERHQDEGFWVDWPAVKGARVLLAHPEAAGLAYPAKEREVRAKGKVREGADTPAPLIVKAAGLAAFGRSVKGWELVLDGRPLEFNQVNFLMMWRVRPFRNFIADQALLFRSAPQSLSDKAGKA